MGEWDNSQSGNSQPSSQIGICLTLPNLGFLWVFFKYPKISKIGNPWFFLWSNLIFASQTFKTDVFYICCSTSWNTNYHKNCNIIIKLIQLPRLVWTYYWIHKLALYPNLLTEPLMHLKSFQVVLHICRYNSTVTLLI